MVSENICLLFGGRKNITKFPINGNLEILMLVFGIDLKLQHMSRWYLYILYWLSRKEAFRWNHSQFTIYCWDSSMLIREVSVSARPSPLAVFRFFLRLSWRSIGLFTAALSSCFSDSSSPCSSYSNSSAPSSKSASRTPACLTHLGRTLSEHAMNTNAKNLKAFMPRPVLLLLFSSRACHFSFVFERVFSDFISPLSQILRDSAYIVCHAYFFPTLLFAAFRRSQFALYASISDFTSMTSQRLGASSSMAHPLSAADHVPGATNWRNLTRDFQWQCWYFPKEMSKYECLISIQWCTKLSHIQKSSRRQVEDRWTPVKWLFYYDCFRQIGYIKKTRFFSRELSRALFLFFLTYPRLYSTREYSLLAILRLQLRDFKQNCRKRRRQRQ